MPQSLIKIAIHAVFSTKERQNLIPQNELQDLWAYLGGIARNTKIVLMIAGGMREPCAPNVRAACDGKCCGYRKDIQGEFVALDALAASQFRLASRIWSFQCEPITYWDGEGIHCQPSRASQEARFQGGVLDYLEEGGCQL
jgi:hypothetical protein